MSIIEGFESPVVSMFELANVLDVAAVPGSRLLLVRHRLPRRPEIIGVSLLDVDTRDLTEMTVENDAGPFTSLWGVSPERAIAARGDTAFELVIKEAKIGVSRRTRLGEASVDSHVVVRTDRDAEVAVALSANWLCSFSASTRSLVERADGESFGGAAVSVDGRFVANGRADGLVEVRDSESLAVVRSFKALDAPVLALAFSPDARYLVAADDSVQTRLIDLESGKSREVYPFSKVVDLAWLPDGSGFVAVGISRTLAAIAIDALDDPRIEIRRDDFGDRYFMGGALVGENLLAIVVEDQGILLASLAGMSPSH
jgi:WD40 repeat protein